MVNDKIIMDWDAGDGVSIGEDVENIISQIAYMANKHNDNDSWCYTEEVVKDALRTALGNQKLICDLYDRYTSVHCEDE